VKRPRFWLEDVNNYRAVIDQSPLSVLRRFHAIRHQTLLLQLNVNRRRDGATLALALGGANDEVIGQDGLRSDVENSNLLALLILDATEGNPCHFFWRKIDSL